MCLAVHLDLGLHLGVLHGLGRLVDSQCLNGDDGWFARNAAAAVCRHGSDGDEALRKSTGLRPFTRRRARGDMGGDSKLLGSMTSSAGRDIFLYPTKLMREHERTMQEVF
jgi:hypothetical protein